MCVRVLFKYLLILAVVGSGAVVGIANFTNPLNVSPVIVSSLTKTIINKFNFFFV